jgi:hypothetical protein
MRIRRTLAQIQVDLVDLSPSTQESPQNTYKKKFISCKVATISRELICQSVSFVFMCPFRADVGNDHESCEFNFLYITEVEIYCVYPAPEQIETRFF